MRAATADLPRPFLLCAHNAQPAGVPILTLHMAERLTTLGYQPVFLLQDAGPLIDQFHRLGPVFISAEGWDPAGLAKGLPSACPAIINTAAAVDLAPPLAAAGLRCLLLLHEMRDYLTAQDLLPRVQAAQKAGVQIIASMPITAAQLRPELGPIPAIRPGLSLLPASLSAFRKLRIWRKTQAGPIFIGAGHADHRKGFDLFLSAAAKLQEARPEACFIWLGALDHWAEQLSTAASADGLRLVLPGFVEDSLAWYRIADAYLLTSRQDPGPTTVGHAAVMGTPFVGYAADIGIREMTAGLGHFVPVGDEPAFVATALQLSGPHSAPARRKLRQHVRREAGFPPYIAALLAQLTSDPAAG